MKGGKPGLNVRRKGALARLEATYEAFKKAGKDKDIARVAHNPGNSLYFTSGGHSFHKPR